MKSVINLIVIGKIVNEHTLDATIICYIGLILGRFIFFDSSISLICLELKKIGMKFVLLPVMGTIVCTMLFMYKKSGTDIISENMIFEFVIIYCAMLFGLEAAKDINKKL